MIGVLFKDVAQRLNIANTLGLGSLVDFMFDNIGNLTSVKSIADTLASNGVKISRYCGRRIMVITRASQAVSEVGTRETRETRGR